MELRWYLLGNKGVDRGFVLENRLYLELVSRGVAVHIGKAEDTEIELTALKGDECHYYQVSLSVRDTANQGH